MSIAEKDGVPAVLPLYQAGKQDACACSKNVSAAGNYLAAPAAEFQPQPLRLSHGVLELQHPMKPHGVSKGHYG